MKIEVVYARPEGAEVVRVELPPGSMVRDALAASGLSAEAVGIFGKRVPLDRVLADGERVEIYRRLAMDPKEARRLRARKKKS